MRMGNVLSRPESFLKAHAESAARLSAASAMLAETPADDRSHLVDAV
jgi:hypothetical protein